MDEPFSARAKKWDNLGHAQQAAALVSKIKSANLLQAQEDVIEVGCGTGLVGLELAGQVRHITMVDTSEGMLSVLKEKIERMPELHNRITVVHGELSAVSAPASVIVIFMTLHHIEDVRQFFEDAKKRLVPGGRLVIGDLYAEDGSFHGSMKVPHNGFDPDKLACELENMGFERQEICPLTRMPKSGVDYPLFFLCSKLSEK